MTRHILNEILFWMMLLVGGGSLAACLVAPAWLEYEEAQQQLLEARQRNAELEHLAEARSRQVEHFYRDLEYVQRFASRELHMSTPGVDTVRLDLSDIDNTPLEDRTAGIVEPETTAAEVAERLRSLVRTRPVAAVFVLEPARRVVMLLSGLLLIGALVLGVTRSSKVERPAVAVPGGR
jgi:cell division protein FtsB